MEYRYKVSEWRLGPTKSMSGNRTIPLTDEAIRVLKAQKEKIRKSEKFQRNGRSLFFLVARASQSRIARMTQHSLRYAIR